MEIDDKLKKYIFKKLANDLSHVEIICYGDSVNFIDRDNNYWYMELKKNGHLWWRLDFFDNFFRIFSLEKSDYEPLIKEWVEQVLKRKATTSDSTLGIKPEWVEKILNRKVITSGSISGGQPRIG
jgi:hypothetical protein